MNHTRLLSILAVFCVLAGAASRLSAEEKLTDLPVTRVVLFSGGVAYFEHAGEITGDATVRLTFKASQINDVLKSMHVSPGGKGAVTGVSYPSSDPQQRALKSFAVDLSGKTDLADLLKQLRGASISVARTSASSSVITGRILGIETRIRQVTTGATVTTLNDTILNLVTSRGIRAIPMSGIYRYSLPDKRLSGELDRAMAMLLGERDAQRRDVDVHFTGKAERKVRIGYLVEAPIWKTSYRLDITGDKPALQGWAIVDNASDFDWSKVELTLVAGRPISFVQDMYQPEYAVRSVIKPKAQAEEETAIYEEPRRHDDEDQDKHAPPNMKRLRWAEAGTSLVGRLYGWRSVDDERSRLIPDYDSGCDGGASIFADDSPPPVATAKKVGRLFHFRVKTPVDLPRRRSSMLMIVSQAISGKKVSIYDPVVLPTQPMNGVLLTNDTDLQLPGGPVAVFEAGSFAGEAVIKRFPPRSRTVLSYSVDTETTVQADATEEQRVVAAGIANRSLALRSIDDLIRVYKISRQVEKPRTLLLRLGRQPHERLVRPEKCEDTTPNEFRVLVELKGKGKTKFMVRTEEDSYEQVTLEDEYSDWLARLAANGKDVDEKVKSALGKIIAMHQDLRELRKQAEQLDKKVQDLPDKQTRLRENIKALDPTSPLVKRYVKKLGAQEDQLEKLEKELADTKARIELKKAEILEFVKDLKVGKMPDPLPGRTRSTEYREPSIFD